MQVSFTDCEKNRKYKRKGSQLTFVFYDTETTGTNTAFDQILQFGAIRTDGDLNEVERFDIRCRLLPYIVPAPGAIRVTGLTIEQITDPALPTHYRMVRAIRAKLEEWSPATFIGHNSIRFDEVLLRQALYQTLHPPYLTSTKGNCRTDSLRLIEAVALLAPGTLNIPIDEHGNQIFRLDQLAPANGFTQHAAHDALGDVEATAFLCRLIAERSPQLWADFVHLARKSAVLEFANAEEFFFLTDFVYTRPYPRFVTTVGVNPLVGSELLVFDLDSNPDDFVALEPGELAARQTDKVALVRPLRMNAAPIVRRYLDAPKQYRDIAPPIEELQRRTKRINQDEGFRNRLMAAYIQAREPREPSLYVEEQIYDGFASHHDNAVMDRFHELNWPERMPLLGQFEDERFRSLAKRLIYTEAPELMSEAARRAYDVAIAERHMADDETVPWLTLPKAIKEADDLIADASPNERKLLVGLREYLRERAENANTLVS